MAPRARTEPAAAVPPVLAAAWGIGDTEGRRGPKPAHSLDEIIAVATALADEEGLAAASLPRVARGIGVTTNALYRYVGSKDELVVLVADRAWGAPPALPAGGWRAAATEWSRLLYRRFLERPWLLDVPTAVPVTPNTTAWLDALLAALEPTGMPAVEMLTCAYLLDGHARSDADLRRNRPASSALDAADGRPDGLREVHAFLDEQFRARGLRTVARVMADPALLGAEATRAGFEFGLARILDGIEAHVHALGARGGNRGTPAAARLES